MSKARNATLPVGLCVVAVPAAVWHFVRSPRSDIAPAAAPAEAPAGQRVTTLTPAALKEEPSVATVPDRSAVQAPQVKHTQPRQSPDEVVTSRAHVAAQPVPDALQMVIEEARQRLVIEDTNPSIRGQLQKIRGLANSSDASLAKLRRKKRAEMARTFRRGYGIDADGATVDALTALFVTESVIQARLWLPTWEKGLEAEGKERDDLRVQMLLDWDFTVFWNVLSRHESDVRDLVGDEAYAMIVEKMISEARQLLDKIGFLDELMREADAEPEN